MILKKKKALITGATGVIGKMIARFFVREGCEVLLSGRSEQALQEIKRAFLVSGAHVATHAADVSKVKDVERLMAFSGKHFGSLDILVTAAGVYGEIGTLEQCDPMKWTEAVHVNFLGTVWCVKYALPFLRKSERGKIILFAGGGEGPLPRFASYASSKGAIVRFTESIAAELSDAAIEVNAISPGLVNSGFVEDLIVAGPERVGEDRYREAKKQLAGRGGTVSPEKAAALAVFLASRASDGLTGRNVSAVWDNWQEIPGHLKGIRESDIYTWRRVKPKDRGYDW